jgi:hypothetical protein
MNFYKASGFESYWSNSFMPDRLLTISGYYVNVGDKISKTFS